MHKRNTFLNDVLYPSFTIFGAVMALVWVALLIDMTVRSV